MMRESNVVIIAVFLNVFIFLLSYALAQKTAASNEATVSDKVEYKAEGFRDPFQVEDLEIERIKQEQTPQQSSEIKSLPDLEIQGIVWGGRFPQAIINNKVVKIGDIIDEARIIDIAKDGVTVTFEKREYNLSSPASQRVIKKKSEGRPL